ncbi:MAG: leucine-rich repeat protein [Clostridia bacterium]|nr:leucine-rich repeat protein [Clostridia bacterium]
MTSLHPQPLTFAVRNGSAVVIGCRAHVTEVTIPAEYNGLPVTSIAPAAFRSHPHLLSVTLPDSLRTVGDDAFADCHTLMSVSAGSGLERLGERAFLRCISLTKLDFRTVPDADITTFAGCYQLQASGEVASYRRTEA